MTTSVLHELRTQAVICTYTKTVLQHVNNFVFFIYTGKG